jgi:hypothetical protein
VHRFNDTKFCDDANFADVGKIARRDALLALHRKLRERRANPLPPMCKNGCWAPATHGGFCQQCADVRIAKEGGL